MLRVFKGKPKYVTVRPTQDNKKREVPENLWTRCDICSKLIYNKELDKCYYVCSDCGYHFRITAKSRLSMLVDEGTFKPFTPLVAQNPLDFPGYAEKITKAQEATGLSDAIIIGQASIDGFPVVFGIIDFAFIGGSMGSVVGEQLVRGFETARQQRLPVVIFSGGGGGARMHEGIISLMQMAKTAQAVGLHKQEGLFFLSVLTHPTMGGIYASFSSLGDVILAEPKALIGFAGPRIVQETTRQKLPEDFQTAEYALKHGMIDAIIPRAEMRSTISKLLCFHTR